MERFSCSSKSKSEQNVLRHFLLSNKYLLGAADPNAQSVQQHTKFLCLKYLMKMEVLHGKFFHSSSHPCLRIDFCVCVNQLFCSLAGAQEPKRQGGRPPPCFQWISSILPSKMRFSRSISRFRPPCFSELKVSPPLFFGASYGPGSGNQMLCILLCFLSGMTETNISCCIQININFSNLILQISAHMEFTFQSSLLAKR